MQDSDTSTQLTEEINEANVSEVEQVNSLLFPVDGETTSKKPEDDLQDEFEEDEGEGSSDEENDSGEDQDDSIDYKQLIPLKTGEKVELGKLKDHFQEQATRLVEVQEREIQISQKHQQLKDMTEWLDVVPPEQQKKARQELHQQAEQEFKAMLDAIPAWKEPENYKLGKAEVFELAAEYGIQDLLATVNDHRAILLLRDFAQLKSAVKSARANVKPLRKGKPKPKPKPKEKGKIDSLTERAKETGNRQDQVTAISALLNK